MYRQIAEMSVAISLAALVFGLHRLHARNPAASASAHVLKNETLARLFGREGHEGRQ